MSATFRLAAKKKVSQDELRRLMSEQKSQNKQGKIENPLAKYNDAGQLTCVLCKSVVRSEKVWQVHLNSKQHRDNVAEAKRLKELTNNFTTAVKVKSQKRPGGPASDVPEEKKIKGILKNATQVTPVQLKPKNNAPVIVTYHNEEIKRAPNPLLNNSDKRALNDVKPSTSKVKEEEAAPVPDQPIPEGFFDDPILDAKIRNIEYKDPVEEEWEKFQKEMKEEASASAEIIAGEQEEATAERQIEEIDEQIRNWSRVLDIELKKDEIKKNQATEQMDLDEDEDSDNETDIDEFLDWRAKKSYR